MFLSVDPRRNPSHSPKIKGNAADVIERSVMGYPSDSSQRLDLLVDGVEVEPKTTALPARSILKKRQTFGGAYRGGRFGPKPNVGNVADVGDIGLEVDRGIRFR